MTRRSRPRIEGLKDAICGGPQKPQLLLSSEHLPRLCIHAHIADAGHVASARMCHPDGYPPRESISDLKFRFFKGEALSTVEHELNVHLLPGHMLRDVQRRVDADGYFDFRCWW
jgi:hypothetical protein